MTPKDFFLKWNGLGCDFDGVYGFQCVDIWKQYNQDVIHGPMISGNAIDYWTNYPTSFYDKISNTPDNFPQEGDVIIWGTGIGQYGHIAICYAADKNHFVSFDQNFPIGTTCHFQSHGYTNVLGWLHPKSPVYPLPQLVITDQTIIPQIENQEVQAIKSQMSAKDTDITNLKLTVTALNASVSDLQQKLAECTSSVPSTSPPVSVVQPWYTILWRWLKGQFTPKK